MMINRDVNAPRRPVYKGVENETKELMEAFERTKSMLVVPQNYYEKYKSLLKDKRVKLARLQPDRNCFADLVVSVEDLEKCADVVPIRGGGSFYSFRTKLNYPLETTVVRASNKSAVIGTIPILNPGKGESWWNIHFIADNFKVENNSVQGIISEIGDVNLENLNLTSKEFEFLNNFKPNNTQAEIMEQNKILKKGVKFNNFIYSNAVSMKLNICFTFNRLPFKVNIGIQG